MEETNLFVFTVDKPSYKEPGKGRRWGITKRYLSVKLTESSGFFEISRSAFFLRTHSGYCVLTCGGRRGTYGP